jgi:O-antigen/teichoic acid export membrane protein
MLFLVAYDYHLLFKCCREKNTKYLWFLFGISFIAVMLGTAFLLFSRIAILFFFGQKVQGVISILPLYIMAIAAFCLVNTIVLYHHARRKFVFSIISSTSAILLILGIILFHATIEQFVSVLFAVAIIDFAVIGVLHLFSEHISVQKLDDESELQSSQILSGNLFQDGKVPTVTIGLPTYNEEHNIGHY